MPLGVIIGLVLGVAFGILLGGLCEANGADAAATEGAVGVTLRVTDSLVLPGRGLENREKASQWTGK